MDKRLNKCDAREPLRTKANLVLRLLMRARGACVSRSIPRDQETTRSQAGGKRNIVALDKFVGLFPYTYIGQEPVEEMFLAALTRF